MIVIVIMGVVYTLVITKLQTADVKKAPLGFKNLKPVLAKLAKESGAEVRLWCFDDCSECMLYSGTTKLKEVKSFFDDSVSSYTYDYLRGVTQKKLDVFFDENDVQKDVCFTFGVDVQGISDQILVVFKEKTYDYTNYFSDVDIYNSMQEAVDMKEKLIEKVK